MCDQDPIELEVWVLFPDAMDETTRQRVEEHHKSCLECTGLVLRLRAEEEPARHAASLAAYKRRKP